VHKYLINRILSVIPVLIVVSIVVFAIIHLAPGDPAIAILGAEALDEDVAALRGKMGLDRPLPIQYFDWLSAVLRGDMGTSVVRGMSVTQMIGDHIQPTFSLTIFSMALSLAIAIPLGVLSAKKSGGVLDHSVSILTMLGVSIPNFLFGLGLMMCFSVKLRWFPVSGYILLDRGLVAHLHSLTLPGIALGIMNSALIMQMTRASMLEVLGSDFILLVKAKGVGELAILFKHALGNAIIPIITVVGQGFIGALSGSAIIEAMFGIPGMGQLIVNSIGRRDYQVIQGIVLFVAVLNVAVNLILDLLYGLADPRIRFVR
jgi:peptide/nickel transport system permease protein